MKNILKDYKNEKASVSIMTLAVYSILFFLAWALYELLLSNYIALIPNEALSAFVGEGVIKSIVWALPAAILIFKNRERVSVSLREMFSVNKECINYLWIFAAFAVYILLEKVVHGGKIVFNEDFGFSEIITVLFVGITEELVFRGWLLNSTVERGQNAAIAVNSLMFLCIHFPRWFCNGVLAANFANLGFICIMALSIVFGYVFVKTRSIIMPIALHMFWDLLLFMIGSGT